MKLGRMLPKTHKHGFEGRNIRDSSWFDDRILESSYMKHVMKGYRKQCHIRDFHKGIGSEETFLRSVAVLQRFWTRDSKMELAQSIVESSDICVNLPYRAGYRQAAEANFGVIGLDGVHLTALVAWAAVCWLSQCEYWDCARLFPHEKGVQSVLNRCFVNFDMIDQTRYTISDLQEIMDEYR